jgi:hypothetical protein
MFVALEIIANSFYALKNWGNYSQQWNMTMISGIWYTKQFENITSPANKNKLTSTSMHTSLEIY